ncbi:MAG: HAMP domain-containing histidine kinase [Lachnospiraceae bacterium]|nr:HAMP domain-containing histidine kinase [Lachnospiraceae bacterium]
MKKLRIKLIEVAFASSVIVFLVMALGLYSSMFSYYAHQADAMTSFISYNGGKLPEINEYSVKEFEDNTQYDISLNDESAFRVRYFIIYLDENDEVKGMLTDHIASVDEDTAGIFASSVLLLGRKVGYYLEYRYRVVEDKAKNERYIIFLDCHDTLYAQRNLLVRIIMVTLLFALAVMLVFAVFSKKILEPFERNQRMQKQFITDASHELKTPLAVIEANAEVLKYKSGDNEWIKNITSQTDRMAKLINQLLILARMEEMGDNIEKESVDMSELVESVISRFTEVFDRKNVTLEKNITPGLVFSANRNQMENLCDILIENASKYVDENGKVEVALISQGGKKLMMTVSNTCTGQENMDCEKIFERFYRTDESRTSSTGGHGIGLSIARRIAEQHKGTITAASKDGKVTFTVRL